jgi:nicotinate-nucleotide adenylyltransferase
MRVALFGGSFNPPHVGHQLAALYVLETNAVDELWFVPTFLHPFDKPLAPFADRFAMCQRAAEALGPRARVSDLEARLGGPSHTLRTVKTLREAHPETAFSLLIGSDLVAELPTWHGGQEIQQLVSFIIVGRAGHLAGDPHAVAIPDISSTEVRAALRDGRSVAHLVPRRVLDYIDAAQLYLGSGSSA